MKNVLARLALAAVLGSLLISIQSVFAQGSAFTYQGQLTVGGMPASGNYDMVFALFATNVGGVAMAGPLTNDAIGVTNGLFTTTIDFGNDIFTGNAYWLDISARPTGNGAFTELTPRQPITPAPYAIFAPTAGTAANVTGAIALSQLPGLVLTNNDTNVNLSGNFSGNGAGITNVPGAIPWQTVSSTNLTASAEQAYLLTNNALSTLTLPASAHVGDIVTVSGAGNNGWEVQANAGQGFSMNALAAGEAGSWTARTSGSQGWASVASSADGTRLVALAQDDGIYTSIDSGTNWTEQFIANLSWQSVASSADGTHLVAVAVNSPIYTSTNSGTNWTAQNSGSLGWVSVASSADGIHLAAVASENAIYTSTNSGTNWTAQNSGSLDWACVASSADGTHLVAAVAEGPIYTSIDSGTNWTAQNSGSPYWVSVASSADGTHLVAVAEDPAIYTSTDSGTNWTAQNISSPYSVSVASSADGTHLAVGTFDGPIYTSINSGTSWTAQNSGSQYWVSIASSADGTKLAAAGYDGQIYTRGAPALLIESAGTTAQFQYIGNGIWQPLTPLMPAATATVTNLETGVSLSGIFSGTFSGSGNALTSLNASQLTSGAVPSAALTSVPAASLTGTIAQMNLGATNSFTPTIGNGSASFTASTAAGYYAKFGSLVYFEIWINWSSLNSVNFGNVQISLPFTVSSQRAVFQLGYTTGITNPGTQFIPVASAGQNYITLFTLGTNGSASLVPISACASSGQIQITGTCRWQ